jgi:hypothetical protein
MNEKMARILRGREDQYPHCLEQQYPRILDKIGQLWGEPELDTFFESLFIDQRGNKQGFPKEVVIEILRLSLLHKERQQRKINQPFDPWTRVWAAKRSEEWESNGSCRLDGEHGRKQTRRPDRKQPLNRKMKVRPLFSLMRVLFGLRG